MYATAKVGEMIGPQTEDGRKLYEYHHSNFNRPAEIRMEEIKEWHRKMGDKPPFRRAVPGGRTFSNDGDMYKDLGPGAPVKPPLRTEHKLPEDKPPFFPVTVTKSVSLLPPHVAAVAMRTTADASVFGRAVRQLVSASYRRTWRTLYLRPCTR